MVFFGFVFVWIFLLDCLLINVSGLFGCICVAL